MLCPACGRENVRDAAHCAFCGHPFGPQPGQPAYVAPPRRPGVITFIAILGLIGGVGGILSLPVSILQLAGLWPGGGGMYDVLDDSAYRSFLAVSIGPGLVASGLWIAAGIGLLMVARWARKLALGLIIYNLASGVIGSLVLMTVLSRTEFEEIALIGGMVGGCFGLVLWIVVLFLIVSPGTVEAYDRAARWRAGG